MNYQYEEAKLSQEENAEIYRNMESLGLSHVYCQACSEEMKPEQARKTATGLIMCRPCYTIQFAPRGTIPWITLNRFLLDHPSLPDLEETVISAKRNWIWTRKSSQRQGE